MLRALARLDAFDRRLFDRLTRRERRFIDLGLRRLSNSANRSLLWLALAGLVALLGGQAGRRAARRGVVAIAITSTLVNLPLKFLARRRRPLLRRGDRPMRVPMPGSFSFPSGHSASAFAFTTGLALEDPRMLAPILPLAAGVAYSRVHLRVHYPLDVLAGAAIGTGMGLASGPLIEATQRWWRSTARVPESERAQTNEVILVTSPRAGHGEKLGRARRAMTEYGLQLVAEITVKDLPQLPRLLHRNGSIPPLVVAAGGDGTVGSLSDYLVGTEVPMGVIPLGTSNDFARSLSIPMSVEHAVRLLSHGRVSRVDAGRLTRDGQAPRHFVHAAAAGLNVEFARFATRADFRRRLGHLAYAAAAAMAIRERPVFSCQVEYGGKAERLELVHLAVVNAPVFGGFLDLKIPGSDTDDQTLDVIMVERLPLRRLLRSALYPTFGVQRRIRGFRTIQVARLRVEPQHPMDVTLDGEVSGKIPGTFEVVPGGLRVVTPPGFSHNSRADRPPSSP